MLCLKWWQRLQERDERRIEFQGSDFVVAVEKQGRLFERLALHFIKWEQAGSLQADDDKTWKQKDLDDGVSVVTFPTLFRERRLHSITRVISGE